MCQLNRQSAKSLRQRSGVRGLLQQLVDGGVTNVEVEMRELYPVGDSVCQLADVRFKNASGGQVATGLSMTLWKNDGTWRIHRDWATR